MKRIFFLLADNYSGEENMVSKRTLIAIVVVIIASTSAYAVWTYPRNVVAFPVVFTAGANILTQLFSVPMLDNQVQVVIAVQSGAAIWTASILSNDNNLWSHTAAQGGQTTYNSGWMLLQSGNYNVSFRTLGFGGVNAQVTITAKGGPW